jgi:hypothetical protein
MKKDPEIPKTSTTEIEQLIERVEQGKLDQVDAQRIAKLLRLFLTLLKLIQAKNMKMGRLRDLLFGIKKKLLKENQAEKDEEKEPKPDAPAETPSKESASSSLSEGKEPATEAAKPPKPGHGRRPASDYTGAKVMRLNHPSLSAGDACPEPGCEGHLHRLKEPRVNIYLTGQPIISATKYERPVLRCSDCFRPYTAELPEEVKKDEKTGKPLKYDETADVGIALYKYGAGMPFYRQENLQESCGAPLPASVQFERCEEVAKAVHPVYRHLVEMAANGRLHHIDDTKVRILSCYREDKELSEEQRRATHTTGIVAKDEAGHKIALYYSRRRHAGENLDELLKKRAPELPPPIKMSDALAANGKMKAKTIEAFCLAHGHRKFKELEENFPKECSRVLRSLQLVFINDDRTREMNEEQRLAYHQKNSGPVMEDLRDWMREQFMERTVEPNSGLGKAFNYLLGNFEELTTFLRVAGAPIENNEVERALKRFVLLRKNSLFFKTLHGAEIGGILMSVIETCKLNRSNPWEYLLALMRNQKEVRRKSGDWLPWNYPREGIESETEARAA